MRRFLVFFVAPKVHCKYTDLSSGCFEQTRGNACQILRSTVTMGHLAFLVGTLEKEVCVADPRTNSPLHSLFGRWNDATGRREVHKGHITGLEAGGDVGQYSIVTSGADGSIGVWDIR